ncbi:AUX/IAA domain [Dillenia turbinata]|uniref:Auxin-responsive protein n=1 Tax=Dillenia turbinata TaxID=194707 RepID=A0AAN8WA39_9MAGN
MNSFEQDILKRRWQEISREDHHHHPMSPNFYNNRFTHQNHQVPILLNDDVLVSSVVPPVTVVLEDRSICHRISLHKHGSYNSLARALRQMFGDVGNGNGIVEEEEEEGTLDLSNAVPGHIVAYEDMEDDLLLAGDLNWKYVFFLLQHSSILSLRNSS